ncbi:MAG: 3-deoxy-D-manno-octulosonic acid transferase [Candidatus Rokuibacteriota bacterium]|nr:MAG: 3-deoxy-D-manno-octulosonic acid transferase [Candidatus Rokubacteria bacterium]
MLLGYLPVLAFKRLRPDGYGRSLGQRLGRFGEGLPREPRCWIHAVSVGEAATAVPLVEAITRRWPQLGIVMTTVTPTGARIVADRLAGRAVHRYFPIDLPGPVRRALDAVNPRFFLCMETELWPNLLRALAARGVPSMIANGRISDRSFRRYRLVRFFTARMLAHVRVLAMQSEEDARRIIALGARPERVVVTGNIKSDLIPPEGGGDALWQRLLGLDDGEPVWVAGSTHRGEEAIVLDIYLHLRARMPTLTLVLAPRHPERVAEVERLVRERRLQPVRRSELPKSQARGAVIIVDTVGELAQIYRVASVVFVGGSLAPTGGHNMLEPALLRKPVLFGPHTTNFRESAELLLEAEGALVARDGAELEAHMGALLMDAERRRLMGEAAFKAVAGRRGAIKHTLELVERYLMDGDRG